MNYKDFGKICSVLNNVENAIYISDKKFTIKFMNTRFINLIGDKKGQKCYKAIAKKNKICEICKKNTNRDNSSKVFINKLRKINGFYSLVVFLDFFNEEFFKLGIFKKRKKKDSSIISKKDYKRIFDHVAVGVFISTKKGKFVDANPALLEMLGYKDKLQFLKLDLIKDIYLNPKERLNFQNMIEAENKVTDYNVKWKRKDGSIVSVLLTAHVRYDNYESIIGYEGICVDQSQRLKMEKELRDAHVFLNKTVQSSPNAIMANDMNGNIIIWNRGAEETFKYKSEEVVGKMNVKDLYRNNLAKKVMKMIRSNDYGGKGKLRSYPMTLMAKDRSPVEGNLSANIIYNEHIKEIASVGIFVDLREQLNIERKLRRTQEQLLQSEKLAAMGRLTSQIAHEINNPLYGIMNTFELLKTEIRPDNKRRKLLDMALSETERLADMLRKMLSFSKPDQESKSLLNVNTILEELLLLNERQLSEHSIKVVSKMDKKVGEIYASKNQLRQVFLNIISNAKDAMSKGGIIKVFTKWLETSLEIKIEDTGVGIKKEHLDLIFEAFFTTKVESVKGVGLGLSVCYGFIKDHEGNIKVKSEIGKGTAFIIKLPIKV